MVATRKGAWLFSGDTDRSTGGGRSGATRVQWREMVEGFDASTIAFHGAGIVQASGGGWDIPVQVAPPQLGSAAIGVAVHAALFQAGLGPSRPELEITATAAVFEYEDCLARLRRWKNICVSLQALLLRHPLPGDECTRTPGERHRLSASAGR